MALTLRLPAGSIVKLLSGGPQMVVVRDNGEDSMVRRVRCGWFGMSIAYSETTGATHSEWSDYHEADFVFETLEFGKFPEAPP